MPHDLQTVFFPVDLGDKKDLAKGYLFLWIQTCQAVARKRRLGVRHKKSAVLRIGTEGISVTVFPFHSLPLGILEVFVQLVIQAPNGLFEPVQLELTFMGHIYRAGTFDIDPSIRVEIRGYGQGGHVEAQESDENGNGYHPSTKGHVLLLTHPGCSVLNEELLEVVKGAPFSSSDTGDQAGGRRCHPLDVHRK